MIKSKINCLFQKSFAIFVALSLTISLILAGGFNALGLGEDMTEAEIQYGLWYLDQLPSPSEDFGTKQPSEDEVKSITKSLYFDKDGNCHDDSINSEKVYDDIKIRVDELVSGKETCVEKAKAIYEWVFKNVTYDEKGQFQGGNRDAIGVFHSKRAICFGYANLVSAMMRLANISCLTATSHDGLHSWNVVYLNDEENNRQGYTILDACWASCDLYNDASQDPLKPKTAVYGDDDLKKVEYISTLNFPALDGALSLEAANCKIMAWDHHKMGAVRLGCMADVDDYDYCVKKNGVEIVMRKPMTEGEDKAPYLTLNCWEEYDNNICISDDILPVNLPVLLNCYDIFDAQKVVISGNAKVIFPDASYIFSKFIGKYFPELPECVQDMPIREKLVQMREKFDFKDSNVYEFKEDKLVEKADAGRVIFDFTKYDDLSDVAKNWEAANEEMCQIYENLSQQIEESNKVEINNKKETKQYITSKDKYFELRQKISDLKQKYQDLLKKHELV